MSSGHDYVRAQVDPRASATHLSRVRCGPRAILPYHPGIATHYEVLGVAPDAPGHEIRSSYRASARRHHPDRAAPGDSAVSMSAINEAYRVLSDPGRRAVYDRDLAGAGATTATDLGDVLDRDDPDTEQFPVRGPNPLTPEGPARYPWKLMLVLAVIGSVLVLVSAALADSPAEEVPDGIIRTDSCVVIEPNGDAREVACTGEDDIVVELLLPTDARCPVGLEPHRDRLGLGIACIVP